MSAPKGYTRSANSSSKMKASQNPRTQARRSERATGAKTVFSHKSTSGVDSEFHHDSVPSLKSSSAIHRSEQGSSAKPPFTRSSRPVSSRFFATPAKILVPRLLFIFTVVLLCVFGLVMVYSASSITAYNSYGDSAYYLVRQAFFLVVGFILLVICAHIPYRFWTYPIVFIILWMLTVALLFAAVAGFGVLELGAERSIKIGSFYLQPAEFAKIVVVFSVAALIEQQRIRPLPLKRFILVLLIAILLPIALIYRQPDLGTAIILAVGVMALAILMGVSWWVITGFILVLILYVVFACITQPYHLERIVSMFDPWLDPQGDGWQIIQSLYAFGSGGIFGTGLGLSHQKYLYLPYAHTDFIFAIIGEELGIIGALVVLLLFGVFIYAGLRIARLAPDILGCCLAGSYTVMIGFQACINMMCVIGIAPVTGKTLPFLSYGGSSLIATMIMVGIIISVSLRSRADLAYERKRDMLFVIDGTKRSASSASRKKSSRTNTGTMPTRTRSTYSTNKTQQSSNIQRHRRPAPSASQDAQKYHSSYNRGTRKPRR